MDHDVIIIGGSYSGMAAGLQLLRARRSVLVVDAGERRNRFASHSHGFLTRDGTPPDVIAAKAREQLEAYPTLEWREAKATAARQIEGGFAVEIEGGTTVTARRLVLALGVTDTLPDIPGLSERWGKHVFHCPYCHGYELDQGRIGVIAVGEVSMHQGTMLPDWGETTFLINQSFTPDHEQMLLLEKRGARIETGRIARITGDADVELEDGRVLQFSGLFTASRIAPASPLAEQLGCDFEESPIGRHIATNPMKETSVPFVFACGDAARMAGSIALAVGDGAMAGGGVHHSLMFR